MKRSSSFNFEVDSLFETLNHPLWSRSQTAPHNQTQNPLFESKYTINEKILGEGTTSVVKQCTRKSDKKLFAVKIIDTKSYSDKETSILSREIDILERLKKVKYKKK